MKITSSEREVRVSEGSSYRESTVVGNSEGTLERLAVHHGMLRDYLRFWRGFLAGDLSHSRSVSRSVRPPFLGLCFDLINLCK